MRNAALKSPTCPMLPPPKEEKLTCVRDAALKFRLKILDKARHDAKEMHTTLKYLLEEDAANYK